MKRVFIILIVVQVTILSAFAGSINAPAYSVMRASSYRNNYNRQIQNRPMPYWQAQSNFSTRGRYQNYSNYNNSVNRYYYNTRMQRSRY